MPMGLKPFDPKKHKPKDVGKGVPSTELTITEHSPDGRIWNIPSLWWTDEGNPLEITNRELAAKLAADYERLSGKKFPRFDSIKKGEAAAMKRSRSGGAKYRTLANE